MPYDTMTMAAVRDELNSALVGGQIQRIIQPSFSSVALAIYAGRAQHWLVLSADSQYARVALSPGRLAKAFPTPSNFVMLLRKYIEGGRVLGVEQATFERILRIEARSGEGDTTLVAEIMGRHSNVLLVSGDDSVLGAIKLVPPRQSRVRPIMPGWRYVTPPAHGRDEGLYGPGPRLDPFESHTLLSSLLPRAIREDIRSALFGILPGPSPFVIDQIALHAGLTSTQPLEAAAIPALVASAREVYEHYHSRAWQPCTFVNERGRGDFAAITPIGVTATEPAESMSEAVEIGIGTHENRDALASVRKKVLDEVERSLRGAERRVVSLNEGLEAATEAGEVMQRGQMILAYQWAIEPRASELDLPDLGMKIPLDPALTPSANAEKTFRRYHKLRDAARRIPSLLESAEVEAARLRELAVFVRLAETEGTLRDLQRELSLDAAARRPDTRKKPAKRGPLRLRKGEQTAIVGRNARENEEVTFQIAGRDDLWMHARERTGAHVILRGPVEDDEAIESAARLAAWYSEGRADTGVDVDVARVRDVRKIPGGPPGRVTYRNSRTVRVVPGTDGWEPRTSKDS